MPVALVSSLGLKTDRPTSKVFRASDDAQTAQEQARTGLDALLECDFGVPATFYISSHLDAAGAARTVEDSTATAATIDDDGSRTPLPPGIADLGYIVDSPGSRVATTEWQHGRLEMLLYVVYGKDVSHQQVISTMTQVVSNIEAKLPIRS